MKTVKLPILQADLSTKDVMDALVTHRARGAVVKRGGNYKFVALDEVAKALAGAKRVPFSKIKHMELDFDHVTRIEDDATWAHVKLGASMRVQFAAPLYVCPNGDHTQSSDGTCPNDGLTLVRIRDM
jgi:hypothetical protein